MLFCIAFIIALVVAGADAQCQNGPCLGSCNVLPGYKDTVCNSEPGKYAPQKGQTAATPPACKNQTMTASNGAPLWDKLSSLTVGPKGPMLMQDVVFMDEMAHFDRERIPNRVVHAKGVGAHGYLEVTNDITKYSKAALFTTVGKKTPLFVRLSNSIGDGGSADTARDARGFAIKFYTEEGNWDLLCIDSPAFFVRDPMLFPSLVHSFKRHPVTHMPDLNAIFDFMTLRPETLYHNMVLYSDRATPDGFRHMNAYGVNTFKLVNKNGEAVFCKFHVRTKQGVKNLSARRALELSALDPNYYIRDLYNAVEGGNFPEWILYIQVMTSGQAEKFRWNHLDVTKVWPLAEYPLIPVGKIVLDRNPINHFVEVEQSAFSPSRVVPGVEHSTDKILQARLFSYPDTQFHRLGPNFMKLPINCPFRTTVSNVQRDGAMRSDANQGGEPVYHPNSFNGSVEAGDSVRDSRWSASGAVDRYNSANDNNYEQPGLLWRTVLKPAERAHLVENMASYANGTFAWIKERVINQCSKVDPEFGRMLKEALAKMAASNPATSSLSPEEPGANQDGVIEFDRDSIHI